MTTASAILQRAEGKAASTSTAPPDIAKVAKPAPGASPVGAFAFLAGDDGTQAWLVKDGDKVTGYLRDASQPTRAIEIDDPKAWSAIVDDLKLREQAVPTTDAAGAGATDPAAPDAPAADAAPPDAAPPAAPDAGAAGTDAAPDGSAPAATATPAAPVAPARPAPPQQRKAAPGGQVTTPADHEEQTGIMVALMVPLGDAQDLALDIDTAEDPTNLHLTLAFLGSTDAVDDVGAFYAKVLDALRDTCSEYEPVSGMVSGIGRFTIDGGSDAFVYLYDSPGLSELRQDLIEDLEEQGITVSTERGFTPHITIAYLQEGQDNPIRRAEPRVLSFDEITFCFGDQRLPIKLGSTDPDEADENFTVDATGYATPDTTAPSAMVDHKGKPNPFAKGGKKGPGFAAGSFVAWGSNKGRVDLVVTNGKVPGVEQDVTGSATSPAARVVVWEQGAGGKWKPTGKKVGVSMSSLKRTLPLNFNGGKKDLDPDEALVGVLTGYYETVGETKDLPLVDPAAVRTVYERGLQSWPGDEVGVGRDPWALGRTKAFLTVAAGRDVPGYEADRDLLPEGHSLAAKGTLLTVTNTGDPEPVLSPEQTAQLAEGLAETEEKVAVTLTETTALDADAIADVLAGLRDVLGSTSLTT